MSRITRKIVQNQIDVANSMLGFDPETASYNTIGSLRLYSAYGMYSVHKVSNEFGGIADLSRLGTLREASSFVSGLIAGLRLTNED